MTVEASAGSIVLLGVLFLGIFVGSVLGLVPAAPSRMNVKLGGALISVALAGAPIAFMGGLTFERWLYPVGLVLGLAWIRMLDVRMHVASRRRYARIFAWVDILAVVGSTLVVIFYTASLKPE